MCAESRGRHNISILNNGVVSAPKRKNHFSMQTDGEIARMWRAVKEALSTEVTGANEGNGDKVKRTKSGINGHSIMFYHIWASNRNHSGIIPIVLNQKRGSAHERCAVAHAPCSLSTATVSGEPDLSAYDKGVLLSPAKVPVTGAPA
jgi:hypothetical protein